MQLEKTTHLIDLIPELLEIPAFTKKWLIENCELNCYKEGQNVFERGQPIIRMQLIVQGKVQIRFQQQNGWREMGTFGEGTITGLLPYSRLQSATTNAVAVEDTAVLSLDKSHFQELIRNHQELTEVLVHKMTSRVREFTRSQNQNEKLMALGKLSAGLAHELNNPAAAIVRSSQLLKRHLGSVPDKFKAVMEIEADERAVNVVNDLLFEKLKQNPEKLTLIERTNKEEELTDYLESIGYEDAFENAELFVDYSFDLADFSILKEKIKPKDFSAVMGWIAQVLTTEKMVDEIEKASSRISDLVGSIKSYTHMDRSQEKELVDPFEGINGTFNILNHKLKRKGIRKDIVVNNDVEPIKVLPSEINQVWMNLIDNAIDACPDTAGIIEVKLIKEATFLKVTVTDNGSGIEEEIISKIFDPFFTTKKIGEGTGLGLDVSKKVIQGHNGTLTVQSKLGKTTFEVCLPYE